MKTKIVLSVIALLALLVFVVLTYFYIDFSSGRQKADKHYKKRR